MAIAIDPTSPALVGGNATSLQTSTFSPPAGSLLVSCLHADTGRTSWSFTSTVVTLTWTQILHAKPTSPGNSASAYYAPLVGGATNMSVTATGNVSGNFGFKVYVVTGYDTSTPVGALISGGTVADTANTLTKTVVPQVANSMGFIVADDFSTSGTTTSPDTTFAAFDITGQVAGGSGYRLMNAAGGTESFSVDAAGTASAQWAWGLFEIRAGVAGSGTVNSIRTHGTARARASIW